MKKRLLFCAIIIVFIIILIFVYTMTAQQKTSPDAWSQFRGPNGSGVNETTSLPVEFGPDKNVVWKTALPTGYSSPVFAKKSIFQICIYMKNK